MSTVDQLPSSAKLMTNTSGVGAWRFKYDSEGNDEHVLTWKVPIPDLAEFRDKALFTPATITIGAGTITRVFALVCPMDSNLVALDMQGGGHQMNRTAHEDGPWEETALASGVWRPNADHPPWPLALATVRFGRPKWPTTGDRPFLEVSEEDTSERRTIPNSPYRLVDGAGAFVERVAADRSIPAGTSRFRVTWHELTGAELLAAQAVFEPLKDKVNAEEIELPLLGVTCAPGTLHMLSKSCNVSVSTSGAVKASLSAHLAHFPGGWNRAVASVPAFSGQLLRVLDELDNPPIEIGDFNSLINY